ncbi:hypothetical protein AAFF_G00095980 [Aldrovandia affinis]|uniref:B30.2/SPRY domain-containing protein n=1 Tax=Aldrovandia affinis TaxID=143900 RepID=A0AAD7WCR5_9TELE|nr:hypothetical protein AAFF_G00095980 [Aldrovandia affinis]
MTVINGIESLCPAPTESTGLIKGPGDVQDQQPVCVICQTSKQHRGHHCCPIDEAVQDCRDKLRTALEPLRENLGALCKVKQNYDGTMQHVKKQARHTERQIKGEFETLHQFLRDEEATRIVELREEEVERSRELKEKIEATAREISSLSEAVGAIEREMAATDSVVFLQNYKDTMKKARRRLGGPEDIAGVLIDVAKHLGCLKHRVWEKMKDIAQYSPVTLDPNTANPCISLSQDLTSLRCSKRQSLPTNLERFDLCVCVLGTEGFTSGRHFWDVEVGDNTYWILGVAQESVKRKEKFYTYPENGFWTIRLRHGQYRAPGMSLAVTEKLQRVRVQLDWDRGSLSFSDPGDDTPLYTFTHTFTERLFPFFCTGCSSKPLSILPVQVSLNYQ